MKVQGAWRCSPKAVGKRCRGSYENQRNSHRKMLLSKAKVIGSSHPRSRSPGVALLLQGFLPRLTRGGLKGWEQERELCHPERYGHNHRDRWPRQQGSEGRALLLHVLYSPAAAVSVCTRRHLINRLFANWDCLHSLVI